MELRLYTSDLLPRYRDTIPCSATRFGHFNKKAQRAILAVGEAMYFTNQNTNYNKIFTPRVQMQIRIAKWGREQETASTRSKLSQLVSTECCRHYQPW